MKLSEAIGQIYNTKWSYINSFSVVFYLTDRMKESGWDEAMVRDLDTHIVSINTPQFSNSPVEVFIGNRWNIQNGRDELYRFSITFRDKDQMSLYRKFVKMYKTTREDYFDHVSFTIEITKEADWEGENDKLLMRMNETIIESVSQLDFNTTTENQVAEFTVNFKCISPIIF